MPRGLGFIIRGLRLIGFIGLIGLRGQKGRLESWEVFIGRCIEVSFVWL